MPNLSTAAFTFSIFFSNSNSGAWIPTMTKPLSAYFSFQSTRYGIVRMQLIQLYVQKSTSTTFPLRSERFIGSVFMYPVILSNSGAFLNCDLSIENCTFLIFVFVVSLLSCTTSIAGTKFVVSPP
jgi:hypothetical protein